MNRRQHRALKSVDMTLVFFGKPHVCVGRIVSIHSELTASRTRLDALMAKQALALESRGADGERLRFLRREVRQKHLLPIAKRGRLILEGLPGIDESLRVPRATVGDAELLAACERIAATLRPHAKAFLKVGFRSSFIKDLERAAAALERARSRSETAINRATRLTRELADELARARRLVAAIDTMARAEFYDDPGLLKMLIHAKRVPGQRGRPLQSRTERQMEREAPRA